MSARFKVVVTREGKWWLISIPKLGAVTQARESSSVPTMAREVISLETGVALADVAVDQQIELTV